MAAQPQDSALSKIIVPKVYQIQASCLPNLRDAFGKNMSRKAKKIEPPSKRRAKTDPLKITTGRGFFILNAVLWFGYGIYIYYDMAVVNNNTASADIVTLFTFVNAGLLLFSGIKLGKPEKWTYIFAASVTAFNTLLSLFNIVDLFFLISFLLDLIILWTIIPLRRQYFPKP
jgi:hypothetical protein